MLKLVALGLLAISISACATASSSPVCPREVEYSKEFQVGLADELALLPAGAKLSIAMIDYGILRNKSRACRGE